ncbi:TPA: YisL family protein [Staphylococcus aureus]|nr:YisL family protein [Staphylococcus aureus]HDL9693173.1 YisL family protein [Staphylococcus aureus]
MLHLHILSWVLAIILFIATYLNISKNQGGTPYFKPLHMVLRLFMLCGVAVVGLMEVSIAKRKRHEQSHTMFWITIALIIITMVLGVILPLGPLSKLFGIG